MKKLSSVLTVGLCTLLAATVHADDATPVYQKWAPWIDVEADPGSHRSIGQFDAFAPIAQDSTSLIFLNPRMRFDDKGSQEYNWGAGYRTLWDKEWVLGGYVYADRTLSPLNNYFSQLTIGLEAMSENWKYRVNDYQPFGTRAYSGQNPSVIAASGSLEISSDTERSLPGDDVEVGYRIPLYDASSLKQLWVYAGGYRFDGPDVRTVEGPRLRFEYEVGDVTVADRNLRIRFSGEVEHDNVRNTQYFAGIRIGIPLDDSGSSEHTSRLTPLERHMVDPVQRDVDIVTGKGPTTREAAINDYNNKVVSGVSTVNASSNIASAVTSAGTNSIVVFDGTNGAITLSASTSINMLNGQTLLGGGSFLQLRGANSGVQAVYYAPGSTPTLTGSASPSLVNLANNGVMKGFSVANTDNSGGSSAITSNGTTHFTIADNSIAISVSRSNGIDTSNSSGTVSGNTITATSGAFFNDGIYARTAGTLTISNNIINLIANRYFLGGSYGIAAGGTQLTLNRNTINIDTGTAISVRGPSATITNNVLTLQSYHSSVNTFGITIDGSNGAIIDNNTIGTGTSIAAEAISIGNSAGVSVHNNTIVGVFGAPPVSLDNATTVSGSGNIFSPTYSSTYSTAYTYDRINHCDASSGTNTGSISFVDGSHCP